MNGSASPLDRGTRDASAGWYFEPLSETEFAPTRYVGGAWNPSEQHIAPLFGLLTHLIERDRDARRGDDLLIGRLSFDIHGVLPVAPFEVTLQVARPGKTIELVEARVYSGQRTAVVARAWLLMRHDTVAIAGTPLTDIPAPGALPEWPYGSVWQGEFVKTVQARRVLQSRGKSITWVNTDLALLKDTHVSSTARLMGLVDVANGASPRASPSEVAFPNLDLTAHLIRIPVGPWVGLDTTVSFGPGGIGLTHSVVHDEKGAVGVVSQCLTVRPMAGT